MADNKEPILDPEPAKPFDVAVNPDPAPAKPFDVGVTLDSSPKLPVDIGVILDSGPNKPFDVLITSDTGPRPPVDVSITLDSAPKLPVDPISVIDNSTAGVQQLPDPVVINSSGVGVPPPVRDNSDPGKPKLPDPVVPTQTNGPRLPSDGLNLASTFRPIINSSSVGVPPPVRDNADPGVPMLPSAILSRGHHPNITPTTQELVDAVKDYDKRLAIFLANIGNVDLPNGTAGTGGALDPRNLVSWFNNYKNAVGLGGISKFIGEQTLLYAMNSEVGKMFDPSYFIKMMFPGSAGAVKTALDIESGINFDTVARAKNKILENVVNISPSIVAGNVFSSANKMTDGQDFTVDEMVEAALNDKPHPFLETEGYTGLTSIQRFDALSYFEDKNTNGASAIRGTTMARTNSPTPKISPALERSTFINGVIRAGIPGEEQDGVVISGEQDPTLGINGIDDDDTRIPLSFTDLRYDINRNGYRTIYFRPLNLNFTNAVTPEYNDSSAFGRVDSIIGYTKTTRTYNVQFEVMAFAPEDIQLIYNKMTWLTSLCYPSYGADSLIKSGPVVRMRIGDAVSTESGGVPGVLKSLNFDFADAMWELSRGKKVPKSYKVSLEFLVLHDGPVGLLNGAFGVWKLPSNGAKVNYANTDGTGNGVPDKDGTALNAGQFMKFGESRKQ